jgi:hypothetical protein
VGGHVCQPICNGGTSSLPCEAMAHTPQVDVMSFLH